MNTYELHCGDCLSVLSGMESGLVDCCVTSPPYFGLRDYGVGGQIGLEQTPDEYVAKLVEVFREVRRVLRDDGTLWLNIGDSYATGTKADRQQSNNPGVGSNRPEAQNSVGRIGNPSGCKTKDLIGIPWRLAFALQADGWYLRQDIIRDSSTWASVLPPQDKWPVIRDALDLPTELDSLFAEAEREVVGIQKRGNSVNTNFMSGGNDITTPATEAAKQWAGWGTALKPAMEPITVARKPLIGTVAANVLKHGTGALNIDGCRVEHVTIEGGNLALNPHLRSHINGGNGGNIIAHETERRVVTPHADGRWPANLIHDGSDEVVEMFPQSKSTGGQSSLGAFRNGDVYGKGKDERWIDDPGYGDSGSAARFFYCAKASKKDRGDQNNHPTVKPTDLMRYLCRLVTPPGGLILDPFMGSGSTGKAAIIEGFRFVGIEREAEYLEIAQTRIAHAVGKTNDMLAFE